MSVLVVGAGLSGSVLANLLAVKLNKKVTVIDRRNTIAGNIFDYKDSTTGIIVHKYGPHIFHTNNKKVWNYLSTYTKWYPFVFEPNAVFEGKICNIPFNLNTIYQVFSYSDAKKIEEKLIKFYGMNTKISILQLKKAQDKDLKMLADYVYENMFKNYTIKQWGIKIEEIDSKVLSRVPVVVNRDNRYFDDKFQGIPLNGYTKMIENLLNHPNIKVVLNTDYKDINEEFEKVFYSGSIDEFFDYKFGKLSYRSLNFDIQTLNQEYYQKTAMTNYPNDFEYTRIIEHKYFLNQKSKKTIISFEYPLEFEIGKNERFYPINNKENSLLYEKYKKEANSTQGLYFIGRLGEYKYYNMDKAVERIFELVEFLEK